MTCGMRLTVCDQLLGRAETILLLHGDMTLYGPVVPQSGLWSICPFGQSAGWQQCQPVHAVGVMVIAHLAADYALPLTLAFRLEHYPGWWSKQARKER